MQGLINALPSNDAGLIAELERQQAPIAKAYLAYWLLVNQGPSRAVNQLMNTAIQQTFTDSASKPIPSFDHKATYDYLAIKQLLLHLSYIHNTIENEQYTLPCWLFEKHPKSAKAIFEQSELIAVTDLKISACMEFAEWEAIKALRYFIEELQPSQYTKQETDLEKHLEIGRSFLYLFPEKLTKLEQAEMEQWKTQFWKDLTNASNKYPVLEKYLFHVQVVFFQSQVLLEEYYIQQGFTVNEAEGLALCVLKTYVEVPLKAYR